MPEIFDLFGDPVPENWGRRGRPQHIPTTENINTVTMLVALGWSNERIAGRLDITLPTFRKHYFSLVKRIRETARDRLDAAFAMHLWKQVQEGSAGAMRLWLLFMDRNDRMGAERAMASGTDKPPAEATPIERVGKKILDAQRAMDADADLMAELETEAAAGEPNAATAY
jgi:ATP/maltotriose-dependent transcriptional regulator MalT